MTGKNLELYIHIPFCVRKCRYCDFLSAPAAENEMAEYMRLLVNEIKACREIYAGFPVSTVFIGGGTPSILPPEQMETLVRALKESFDLSGLSKIPGRGLNALPGRLGKHFAQKEGRIEFTVECNPGTIDRQKLETFRKAGVNRLSFGLQSIHEKELAALGRIHTFRDFLDSYEMARETGFQNINLDLMQSIPYQTVESWEKTLLTCVSLKPEHISAYSLQIEEGTPFYAMVQKGGNPLYLPDEDTERQIFHMTGELLRPFGYGHYEISNYALPGKECRHNLGYWTRKDYLGLGLGASSLVDNTRWKNPDSIEAYRNAFSDPEAAAGSLHSGKYQQEKERLRTADQMAEYVFLGLRLTDGISKKDFIDTFGVDFDIRFGDVTRPFIAQGLLEESEVRSGAPLSEGKVVDSRVRLTPKGVDVSNRVMAAYLPEE